MKKMNFEDLYSLSSMQEGILFHMIKNPDSGMYFEQFCFTVEGSLEVDLFLKAWQQLVLRHPIFRTFFVWEETEKPIQIVRKDAELDCKTYDWNEYSNTQRERKLKTLLEEDLKKGFDLKKPPLMRIAVVKCNPEKYYFIWSFNHIILDGWSIPVLFKELFAFYMGLKTNVPVDLPAARPYKDYIAWFRNCNQAAGNSYWKEFLKGYKGSQALIINKNKNKSKAAHNDIRKAEYRTGLTEEQTLALKNCAREHGQTVNNILNAAFALLLERYGQGNDVVYGTTISGRPMELPGIDEMLGLFINTVPVRVKTVPGMSVESLVSSLREQQVNRLPYEYVSLANIGQSSEAAGGKALFEVLFIYENYQNDSLKVDERLGFKISDIQIEEKINFPLAFIVLPGDALAIRIIYDQEQYESRDILTLAEHFKNMLSQMVTQFDAQVETLSLLSDGDFNRLGLVNQGLDEMQNSVVPSFAELFEKQVAQMSSEVAVESGEVLYTYSVINHKANQLCNKLQQKQIPSGAKIGLMLGAVDSLVAMVAALKGGWVFVPLDLREPVAVLNHLCITNDVVAVMTTKDNEGCFGLLPPCEMIFYEETGVWESCADHPVLPVSDESAAYVVTVNGTGITVSQKALALGIGDFQTKLQLSRKSRLLINTAFTQDWALWQAFAILAAGGRLILPDGGTKYLADAEQLAACLQRDTNIIWSTHAEELIKVMEASGTGDAPVATVLCRDFDPEQLPGDRCRQDLSTVWGAKLTMYYSIPELPEILSMRCYEAEKNGELLTGLGFADRIVVLDPNNRMLSNSFCGSVYVCLRDGEVKTLPQWGSNPQIVELTHANQPNLIAYATGDQGYQLPGGQLRLQGGDLTRPIIGGRRVDCRYIEAVFLREETISQCLVMPRWTTAYKQKLVVYLVADDNVEIQLIVDKLHDCLPPEMDNAAYVKISAMPYTEDGTIDFNQLAAIEAVDDHLIAKWNKEVAALAEVEEGEFIKRVWKEAAKSLHLADLLSNFNYLDSGEAKAVSGNSNQDYPTQQPEAEQVPPAIRYGAELVMSDDISFSMGDLLKRAARKSPTNGIVYLRYDGTEEFQSYPELLDQAMRVAGGLYDRGLRPGEQVMFQLEDNRNYITCFWGCMLGGFVPVPVSIAPSYKEINQTINKLYNSWEMLGRPTILVDRELFDSLNAVYKEVLKRDGDGFSLIIAEELVKSEIGNSGHHSQPDDLAILLLTSGSTGMPKAVMQTHRTLISRTVATCIDNKLDESEISFNWMPLDHVGGIVMFHLRDVYLHCRQIHAPTNYILQDPIKWIELLSRNKATVTWAPNFAYNLINNLEEELKNKHFDLTPLHFILNGGEAIVAKTALRFLEVLKPFGLRAAAMKPSWGMSETCSGVVYSLDFGAGLVKLEDEYVSVGTPIPGFGFRIADRNGNVLRENEKGFLEVKGLSVTPGYFKNDAVNAESFTPDGWYITGDIGMVKNGSLIITGREKDVIIINGVNYNNSEIEAVVEELDGVQVSFTAATSIRDKNSDTDQLVIFFAPVDFADRFLVSIIKEIQEVITKKIRIQPQYIIPVAKEVIPKTGIGKIQRIELRNKLLDGVFNDIIKHTDLLLGNQNTLPDWFYSKAWFRQESRGCKQIAGRQGYLIFQDRLGLADRLKERLAGQKVNLIVVSPGSDFQCLTRSSYVINPESKADYEQLISAIKESGLNFDNIVHLWAYEKTLPEGLSSLSIRQAQRVGVFSLLYLTQALEQSNGNDSKINLFVVCANTQPVSNTKPTDCRHATLVGFLRSLSSEAPWISCRLIDLENQSVRHDSGHLFNELVNSSRDPEVAYRDNKRMVWRFVKENLVGTDAMQPPIKPGGLYLLTGGLGGIGTLLAKLLIEKFNLKLLILGRTNPESFANVESDQRWQNWRKLEALKGEVLYRETDLTDYEALEQLTEEAERKWGCPLEGVFHLAGAGNLKTHWQVMDEHWVRTETEATFEMMFAPKVYGTFNLYQLLQKKPDGVMISFSSINGTIGGSTFSAYSAANSFHDAFSARQYDSRIKTYCLCWTMWDNVGMSFENPEYANEASRGKGLQTIPVKKGLNSFLAALAYGKPYLIMGLEENNSHIGPLIKKTTCGTAMVTGFVKTGNPKAVQGQVEQLQIVDEFNVSSHCDLVCVAEIPRLADGAVDTEKLLQMADGKLLLQEEFIPPQTELEIKMAEIWKEVLDLPKISVTNNFFELGGHSLKATQVISRIRKQFQIDLPLNSLFEHATVRDISGFIEAEIGKPIEKSGAVCDETIERIPEAQKQRGLPLSFSQQRLWFLKQYDPESSFYNVPAAVRLKGKLDLAALHRCLNEIVARHESLRTTFITDGGNVQQVVAPPATVSFPLIDLTDWREEERELEMVRLAKEEAMRNFNLETGPLARFSLIRLTGEDHVMLLTMHHIISDGWSIKVFVQELGALFGALSAGREALLPPLPVQYVDFAVWQRKWFQGEVMQQQLAYWKERLQNLTTLELATDFTRPPVETFRGAKEYFTFGKELTQNLRGLCQNTQATLFMILLSGFKILLAKYSNQTDIVVGTPIANRRRREVEDLIGFFVNTLVLRADLSGDPAFTEVLERVKNRAMEAYANQDIPFEMLVDELGLERDLSRNPVFQVMFALQNQDVPELELPNLSIRRIEIDTESAMFDIWLSMREYSDNIAIVCEYNTDLFRKETIRRMVGHLQVILETVCQNPAARLSKIPLLTQEEQKMIVVKWNETNVNYPCRLFIHEQFTKCAGEYGNREALRFEDQTLTYSGLNQRVNQLAHFLIKQGVGPDVMVGVYMERSVEMVVGLLGILKAGGAYVPIDPTYPADRVSFMIQDSGVTTLLTQKHLKTDLSGYTGTVICLDEPVCAAMSTADPNVTLTGKNIAYMIYTSGSTGRPKGVMNTHEGIQNRLLWMQDQYRLDQQDRVLQKTPFSFDVSVWEFFWPLMFGACLVVAKPEGHKDTEYLVKTIINNRITMLHFVPSMLKIFLENPEARQITSLKRVICSGEALPYDLKEQFFQLMNCELHNLYGPTEAAVDVTYWDCSDKIAEKIVPIGRPIANTQIYILDPYLNPVPVGVPGELHIGGVNLAKGYHNRSELTAEKFIKNPFNSEPGSRLYKTGDLVRYLPTGDIEYLQRIDNQIKIRGFRVELGEIERVIQADPSIQDCAVIAREDEPGNKRLVAYIVKDMKHSETKMEDSDQEQLFQWKSVFDNAYSTTKTDGGDSQFNIVSWNSSYTGEPIPGAEMKEWLDDAVATIRSLKPRRVLELGCGTGLILFKIAPECESYVGTDLSETGLAYIRDHCGTLDNIRLFRQGADDFNNFATEKFDTIILNSVVQYFPGQEYLLKVIKQCLNALQPGGRLFLGDIRSLRMLETYHASVEFYKAEPQILLADLQKKIQSEIERESELLIDSEFFAVLQEQFPNIGCVEVFPKNCQYSNEMSKFRYQVVLKVGNPQSELRLSYRDWFGDKMSIESLKDLLNRSEADEVGIANIPNLQLSNEISLMKGLKTQSFEQTVGDLKRSMDSFKNIGVSIRELNDLENETPYFVKLNWLGHAENGSFDAIFLNKKKYGAKPGLCQLRFLKPAPHTVEWDNYMNDPLQWKRANDYLPKLRSYLKETLPDYMVPSFFVMLEKMPLLPNGKLDRKQLPVPENTRKYVESAYQAPDNDMERKLIEIWQETLQLERVGTNDNFFDVGGHSLLLVQVYYKIKAAFNPTNLTVVDLFQYPTIHDLSNYLRDQTNETKLVEKHRKDMVKTREAFKKQQARIKKLVNNQ
jgi:amino acid adenylation domain-containing protein